MAFTRSGTRLAQSDRDFRIGCYILTTTYWDSLIERQGYKVSDFANKLREGVSDSECLRSIQLLIDNAKTTEVLFELLQDFLAVDVSLADFVESRGFQPSDTKVRSNIQKILNYHAYHLGHFGNKETYIRTLLNGVADPNLVDAIHTLASISRDDEELVEVLKRFQPSGLSMMDFVSQLV